MIHSIVSFSLKNKLIIGILTIALIAWGVCNFKILPIDAVPDITRNQVQVITVAPSLVIQEVKQFITFPVEIAMANIHDVVKIRSISRSGLSVVTVVSEDNVDLYLARQLVSEQIKVAENGIPEAYGNPEMKTVKELAYYDNNNKDEKLIPGMMISARIHTDENTIQAFREDALIFDGYDEFYVFHTLPSLQKTEGTVFYNARLTREYVEDGFA